MTPRNVLTLMAESSCFRTPFESQRVHTFETLQKPGLQHFYFNFRLMEDRLSWKTSHLVRFEMLRLFCNTLAVDHMYSPHSLKKFPQLVQRLLSEIPKTCSEIFIIFMESTKNFGPFEEKDELHGLNFSEVIDSEKCGYFNSRKPLF